MERQLNTGLNLIYVDYNNNLERFPYFTYQGSWLAYFKNFERDFYIYHAYLTFVLEYNPALLNLSLFFFQRK